MKPLKWNLENFDFYYVGNLTSKYTEFNNENYNSKFEKLLDNDKIIRDNINDVFKVWKLAKENRVPFEYLIKNEINVIYNEIKKAVEIFDFLNEYVSKTGKCFVNTFSEHITSNDSIILVSNGSEIIGMLNEDGEIVPYTGGISPNDANVQTIFVNSNITANDISSGSVIPPSIQDVDFCKGEVTMEEKEYVFC